MIDGALMASEDGGRQWRRRADGLGDEPIDTIVLDPSMPNRIWAAAADRIHVSHDLGSTWRAVGQRATRPWHERARHRSRPDRDHPGGDDGEGACTAVWMAVRPGLSRRATCRFTSRPGLWCATRATRALSMPVYSLMPYAEVWRTALEGSNLLARTDPVSLAGGLAFVLLLMIGGALLVRWLARRRSAGAASGGASP